MSFLQIHRRALVACFAVIIPLLTLIASEVVAQMRLTGAMTESAERLLASLSPAQKARMQFPFGTLERFNWHYIPRMRKGLALRELPDTQKALALALMKTGLSAPAYATTEQIRSLELILVEREKNGSVPMVRDPENIFFTVFGTPSREQPWAWRVEGHHISVNVTVAAGRVRAAGSADGPDMIANTPLFFGAEPALLAGGPRKGLRVLGAVEDKARALIDAFDAGQRAAAIIGTQLPVDIFTGNDREPDLASQLNPMGLDRQPETFPQSGLVAAHMTPRQKDLLKILIDEYLSRMPDEIAQMRSRALAADFDKVSFAWIGATRPEDAPKPTASFGCEPGDPRWECIPLGFPYYYRVLGPTFLIEYMNTNGNHSHSVWRDYQNGDFGEDLLRAHYADVPHDGAATPAVLARAR
jgi:hypothetical protein